MEGELIINGYDAWEKWGVRMGQGFIDALLTPASPKEIIKSSSRLESGIRIALGPRKSTDIDGEFIPIRVLDSRELTLTFSFHASTERELSRNRQSFIDEILNGFVTLQVTGIYDGGPYKLVWTGLESSFGMSLDRCNCRLMLKFTEPNPVERGKPVTGV